MTYGEYRAMDTIDDAAMQAVKAVTKGEFNA
jgi:hypothetical protein